jgi:oxygen-independent coproporphyrinogen-3 oxidase
MIRHLYVHVPFCARICPYCAFYVHLGGAAAQRDFVTALRAEWQRARAEFPLALETIYFGGGTPSILSAELFRELAEEIAATTKSDVPVEFTLEVNPATVTPEKAAAWREAGVNRISLGAQAFDAEMLRLLGRQHEPEEIPLTCDLLRGHGFDNINLDLMFALPGQSEELWTYEEDTPFFEKLRRGEWRQDEAREIAMFERTRELLGAAGLVEYEISNFARPGCESRHNLAYWRGADYLGLGPSACSTVGTWRWKNVPDTAAYRERIARGASVREELEELSAATRAKVGVARDEFVLEEAKLKKLESDRLAFEEEGRVKLTPRGKLVADSVAAMFV